MTPAQIRAARPPRAPGAAEADPLRPNAAFVERERAADGRVVPVATVLLRGRECPWACLMCDLWRHTLPGPTPRGAVPAQLDACLPGLAPAEHIKLYNAGSFFDARAVPTDDYSAITARLAGFRHIVVESHPRLVGARTRALRDLCRDGPGATLEVALGLETVEPRVLPLLAKGATLDDVSRAAEQLAAWGVALRCFVLVGLPDTPPEAAAEAALRAVEWAVARGAAAISLIPTRLGNGALELLAAQGRFQRPHLADVERALTAALALVHGRARVFADTWELASFATCPHCADERVAALDAANLTQRPPAAPACTRCGFCPAST